MSGRTFNAGQPLAYFLTWTSYGTWLLGDERGWWHQGEFREQNELFLDMAAGELKETEFRLAASDRETADATIRRHCEIRGWTLHEVAARSNHVHVVVTAPDYAPDTVREQFKAWCTRNLKPFHPGRMRFWTEGGSVRWINHDNDLQTAIAYVRDAQDRKGLES